MIDKIETAHNPDNQKRPLRVILFDEDRVIKVLQQCTCRIDAKCSYDFMAGGLVWDDEVPRREDHNYLRCAMYLREAIAYRASLTKGKPREELREAWDDLKNKLKEWPGFREERIGGEETKRILKEMEDHEFGTDD